ncbi:MAG: ABC transporter permease [Lachnospiraceae bacterium]|nr:ABC transporter permease [Lachnospiraceae bacterium]
MKGKYTKELRLFAIFVILFLFFAIMSPDRFLTRNNIMTMLKQMPELGLLTIAIMLVILTKGNNLSNVATAILSSILSALVMAGLYDKGHGAVLSICVGLLAGFVSAMLCGVLNGIFVAYIGVASMLTTLASSTFFKGISMNITQGRAISGFPEQVYGLSRTYFVGIPILCWIYVICIVIVHIMLEHTRWGRTVYMLGCNMNATEYAGVKVKKELLKVYLLSAALSFVGGFLMISRYNSAKVDYGSSYLLQSLTASVLGGVDISGGNGSVIGAVIAVMILQVLSSGMNILNVNRFFTDIITGAILIFVLALNFVFHKINAKRITKQ